ncbi:hypothetical protein B0H10DRAFT_2208051 [Mycena sp. CBHHK59/15]|nr:hypothetical protein B0H10DRAFT_2208051 [Mycena sp. CBHHK59/15]
MEPTAPQRVEELWFDDGNLVVQAGRNLHRVYRGVLAKRSPVFEDMLSFPQPPDSELVDGCPVVHFPDSEADVTVFLKAIFDSGFFMPYPARTELSTIAGVLRLSKKYEVDYLRRRALVHLSTGYSTTLSDHDNHSESTRSWSGDEITAHIAVARLAREVEALWILPYAYYLIALCTRDIQEVMDGGIPDGGLEIARLDAADQLPFLRGYLVQRDGAMAEIASFLYSATVEGCSGGRVCDLARLAALNYVQWNHKKFEADAIDIWVPHNWEYFFSDACPACLASLKRLHQESRQSFWDKLPAMYGLPDWDELEQLKSAAIGTDYRVEGLWFPDGNLIVQAGNKLHRVYRGVLAARSPVFHDMLSFPQPPDSELVEGCPLVLLHDYPSEVTVFLKAIFDSDFFMPYPTKTDFLTMAGVLRLSHKYGVDYLRRRALVHLSSFYHTRLSDRDAYFDEYDENENDSLSLKAPSWTWPEPPALSFLFLIQLAREVDAPWILPYTFYLVAASFHALGVSVFHGTLYNGMPTKLTEEDQLRFLRGYHIQKNAALADILRFLYFPLHTLHNDGCTTEAQCIALRLGVFEPFRATYNANPCVPLDIWEVSDWDRLADICSVCLASLEQTHKEARQKFWDNLPKMYDFPGWAELETLRARDVGAPQTA